MRRAQHPSVPITDEPYVPLNIFLPTSPCGIYSSRTTSFPPSPPPMRTGSHPISTKTILAGVVVLGFRHACMVPLCTQTSPTLSKRVVPSSRESSTGRRNGQRTTSLDSSSSSSSSSKREGGEDSRAKVISRSGRSKSSSRREGCEIKRESNTRGREVMRGAIKDRECSYGKRPATYPPP